MGGEGWDGRGGEGWDGRGGMGTWHGKTSKLASGQIQCWLHVGLEVENNVPNLLERPHMHANKTTTTTTMRQPTSLGVAEVSRASWRAGVRPNSTQAILHSSDLTSFE